jgi:hypothetical protein
MSECVTRNVVVSLWMPLAALAVGCETLHEAGVPGMRAFVSSHRRAAEEESHRHAYQQDRSPASMQWLLAHRVHSGMSVADVSRILGEEGVREYDDLPIKTNGGHYRTGDQVYHWGPNSVGRTVYLVFRDGSLVNFNPDEFREPLLASH